MSEASPNIGGVPIVHIKDGQVFANSRDVAEYFGKEHRNVLADIRKLSAELSAEISAVWFQPATCRQKTGFGYRNMPAFDMTRDGFTLLAMGFTGKRALEFKLKYIAAFNEMEAKLKASTPALPDFSDPVAAARAWADAYEQKRIAEQRVQELTPLAVVGSRAVAHEHSLGRFVRTLPGVNTMKIKSDLKAFNYLYKKDGAYRVYSRFQHLFVERVVDEYGTIEIFPTAEGRALIISLYEQGRLTMKKGHLPRMAPAKIVWCNDPEKRHEDLPLVGLQGDHYFRPMWVANEMAEYTGSVMAIDPSGRGDDETSYAVVKILHGNLFVTASGGFKDGYGEKTLQALATIAAMQNVNKVIVEANFGDGMFTQLLKPVFTRVHPVTIEEVKHSQQKERRICDTLEPLMNQHRLIFDHSVIKQDYERTENPHFQLMYQMSRITRDRGSLAHDDRLDVLAIAVGYWVEHMSRDTLRAHEEHLEELREKEFQKFIEDFHRQFGEEPKEDSWIYD